MGWRENLILVGTVGLISLGLAGGMAAMGYWLVLPFAGLELIALTFCLHKTLVRLEQQEVITIGKDTITVEWGARQPQRSVQAPRHWSRLSFRSPDNPFDVGLLALLVHNKAYRLGTALGKVEKQQLFSELKEHFEAGQVCTSASR